METDITEKIKPIIRYSLPIILIIAAVLIFGIFKWNEAKSILDISDAKLTSSVVHVSSQSDGTLTEIFVNDGEKAMSSLTYTGLEAEGIAFEARGEAEISVCQYNVEKSEK